ncbi:F-actin-capping protein subunit alpha [Thraustotheca clavata]|uniref:F-actin-capping protein subunit alpha n=1 Tax=Thraustotheca clavata TaxID=74557 RepID=A0A1V9YSW9_9STRA|nr:F-actin-capping protein subunit alpha [Thraustotheca clavata]
MAEGKLSIARRLLQSSPPGELRDVAKDVSKLLPAGLLSDATLNHSYLVSAMTPDRTHRIVISKETEVDLTHYLDSKNKKIFGFDHINHQLKPNEVQDCPEKFSLLDEPYRLALQNALDDYSLAQYTNQGVVAVVSTGENEIAIVISTERINLRNYWSGRWTSQWKLQLEGQAATLSGSIDLHVHYYEDGNVQLQSRKDVEQTITYHDPSSLASAVAQAIIDEEHVIHSNLEDMYINMSEETFKEMRRVMPVTQTKMDWSIHAHRTAKDLGQK